VKEVLGAVLPISMLVFLLNFTIAPLESEVVWKFIVGILLVTFGLAIFLIGVDIGITPIGNMAGSYIAKKNKLSMVLLFGLILGFFVSIAEPDLHILAAEVDLVMAGTISKYAIIIAVSIGIAVLLVVGLLRITYNLPLYIILLVVYGIIFLIACLSSKDILAIAFDASGATTGAMTVPFMLAIATGISSLKKDRKSSEKDSFGLVAIVSTGAILGVLLLGLLIRYNEMSAVLPSVLETTKDSVRIGERFLVFLKEVAIALFPIVVIFMFIQWKSRTLHKQAFRKTIVGILFTWIGLVFFLTGVNSGFMLVGELIGQKLIQLEIPEIIVMIGFLLGVVTILAEPAVYVLTNQIEDVTSGYVKKSVVVSTMAIGVGIAVALSVIRIMVPQIQLWHYLLPGYMIAIALTFYSPKLFVGIAFDSGGVASGPMTATFILAFMQGITRASEESHNAIDGFGMIAMVALTPLIALQILGILYKVSSERKKRSNGKS